MEERLNEIMISMSKCQDAVDIIWASDANYIECSNKVIQEYAKCLGQISAIITAAKIDAKRGIK